MEKKKGFVTIGYGKTDIQKFIAILLRYKVNFIADVRTKPYSRFNSEYNKEALKEELAKHNISYKWLGKLIGGRPDDDTVYDIDGVVDYEKQAKTEPFLNGLQELEELSVPNNVAIMCSEGDPLRCHRFLAISRQLAKRDYKVVHILDERNYIAQAELEAKLVKQHFGDVFQLDLFTNQEDTTSQSYIKQTKIHAYRRGRDGS